MHKFIISLLVPTPIPERDRAYYHKLIRLLTILFSPITVGLIFLILKYNNLWFDDDYVFDPTTRRVSQVGFKMILYLLIPNLVFLYNQTINSADYVLIYVCGFPDSFVVLYHIWRLGIVFDDWFRNILYICYYGYALFSLLRLVREMMTYGLDQLIAERLNGAGDLRRVLENHGPLATVKSAVDTLSNMNLQQLIMHRNRLESDLKQVEEKIEMKMGSNPSPMTDNVYSKPSDLKTETCVICLSAPPVYQFVPCYHCCLCEDCVLYNYNKTIERMHQVVTPTVDDSEQDILSRDDYLMTTDNNRLSFAELEYYKEQDNFLNCPGQLVPEGLLEKCVYCQQPASSLELINSGLQPHSDVKPFDEMYHYYGTRRGHNETTKLLDHYKNNPDTLLLLKPETRRIVSRASSLH